MSDPYANNGSWNPEDYGAKCDQCALAVLRDGPPVFSELRDTDIAIVAEAPGQMEVEVGRPLVGPSGQELARGMDTCGQNRFAASYHNAISCRPERNNLKLLRARLRKINKQRADKGLEPYLDPVEACRPRLLAELEGKSKLIVLGKTAFNAVVKYRKGNTGIIGIQGNLFEKIVCLDGRARDIVPVIHPSAVLHAPKWRAPFRRALKRAFDWFAGKLEFVEPEIVYDPPASWITTSWKAWALTLPYIVYDTETNSLEPWHSNVRCVQIGIGSHVIVFSDWSVNGFKRGIYTDAEILDILRAVKEVFEKVPVVGHNAAVYDRAVMERYYLGFGVQFSPVVDIDTLSLHRYIDPELPHGLGFVGAMYTDVHNWKADGKEAEDDRTLHRYGALDTAVNARAFDEVLRWAHWWADKEKQCTPEMRPRGISPGNLYCAKSPTLFRHPVVHRDMQMQAVCFQMHRHGCRIDQARRREYYEEYQAKEIEWTEKTQDLLLAAGYDKAGSDGKGGYLFNPQSPYHIRDLLFEEWDLPFPAHLPKKMMFTDSDERSTGDAILRAYIADETLPMEQRAAIHAIRRSKKMRTLHGRFLRKLKPYHELTEDDDYLAVWPDGRLRVGYSAHGTIVGRLASGGKPSGINFHTFPYLFKDVVVPADGHLFIYCDLSNIHLRIIANRWQIPSLIDDYVNDRDPHVTLANIISNGKFHELEGQPEGPDGEYTGPAKMMRNVAKTLRYAGAYAAEVATIHAAMTRGEDKNGNLTMAHITQQDVRAFYNAWMGQEPEWSNAWDREIIQYKENGFMLSPLLGRRFDFLSKDDKSAVVNFPILSCEADIMGLMTINIANRIPWGSWSPHTGIVTQVHDSILVEVPEHRAEEARQIVAEEMNMTIDGWVVPIHASAKILPTYKEGA